MSRSVWRRLAGLMFLQYFILGLWAVTLAAFLMGSPHDGGLNLSARHVGLIFGTFAIAATISPLVVGLLADRLFATQRVLSALNVMGALLLALAAHISITYQTETEFVFDKLAMVEPAGSDELWRLLWERDSIEVFLANPSSYPHKPPSPLSPYLQKLGRYTGYWPRWMASTNHPPKWASEEAALARLAVLNIQIAPAVQRVRAHPDLLAASEQAFPPLFGLMFAYACVYLPALTLTNALTFRNLASPARQYSPLRAIGSVGWVVAGLVVGFAAPAVSPLPLFYAAVVSALLAGVCLFLPHTPPSRQSKTLSDTLGLPALRLLGDRSFLVFVLTAMVATALMPFYNTFTNKYLVDLKVAHAAAMQTLAQPTEIAGALLMPWLWARIGARRLLLLGLVASAARFAVFALQDVPAVLAIGLPLHGIGFCFFYIAASVYIDRLAPRDLRASAQGLVMLLTSGAGGIFGNWLSGRVVEWQTEGGIVNWGPVWLVPALGTLAAAIAFGLCFRDPKGISD